MAFEEFDGAMFGPEWRTSTRKHKLLVDQDVKITMSDGIKLDCDLFRPGSQEKFPAILGFNCSYIHIICSALGKGNGILGGPSSFKISFHHGYRHTLDYLSVKDRP